MMSLLLFETCRFHVSCDVRLLHSVGDGCSRLLLSDAALDHTCKLEIHLTALRDVIMSLSMRSTCTSTSPW
jgi:hypothetical protein